MSTITPGPLGTIPNILYYPFHSILVITGIGSIPGTRDVYRE